jgi:hypothetical protein
MVEHPALLPVLGLERIAQGRRRFIRLVTVKSTVETMK